MRRSKRYIAVTMAIVCVIALVAVACGAPPPATDATAKTIKIGHFTNLTGGGATWGSGIFPGIDSYFKYVNNELGGIEYKDPVTGETNHVLLEVNQYEEGDDVAVGISGYKRAKSWGAKLITLQGASVAEGMVGLASKDEIPVYNLGGMTPTMVAADPRYNMGFYNSMAEQVAATLGWIKDGWTESRAPRVGIAECDIPSHRPVGDPRTFAYAESLGVEMFVEWIPIVATDNKVEITRLVQNEVDWIITGVGNPIILMKDGVRTGATKDIKWLLQQYNFDERWFKHFPDGEMEGFYLQSLTALPSETDVPGIQLASEVRSKYDNQSLTLYYLQGFVFAMTACDNIKAALEEVGYDNLSSSAINYALQHMTNIDTMGLTPPITVDPDYPITITACKYGIVEPGYTLKILSDFVSVPPIMKP